MFQILPCQLVYYNTAYNAFLLWNSELSITLMLVWYFGTRKYVKSSVKCQSVFWFKEINMEWCGVVWCYSIGKN